MLFIPCDDNKPSKDCEPCKDVAPASPTRIQAAEKQVREEELTKAKSERDLATNKASLKDITDNDAAVEKALKNYQIRQPELRDSRCAELCWFDQNAPEIGDEIEKCVCSYIRQIDHNVKELTEVLYGDPNFPDCSQPEGKDLIRKRLSNQQNLIKAKHDEAEKQKEFDALLNYEKAFQDTLKQAQSAKGEFQKLEPIPENQALRYLLHHHVGLKLHAWLKTKEAIPLTVNSFKSKLEGSECTKGAKQKLEEARNAVRDIENKLAEWSEAITHTENKIKELTEKRLDILRKLIEQCSNDDSAA